uniref:Uncharacterized protein n=1 Tax=Setaria italica TaxID=4555 RepID=K3XN88_SETIT
MVTIPNSIRAHITVVLAKRHIHVSILHVTEGPVVSETGSKPADTWTPPPTEQITINRFVTVQEVRCFVLVRAGVFLRAVFAWKSTYHSRDNEAKPGRLLRLRAKPEGSASFHPSISLTRPQQ